ncbi:MAG: lysophospholipid acyltransferase family protein [Micromonosporaceae bacterium]
MSVAATPGPWTVDSPCGPGCLPASGTTPSAPLSVRLLRYAGLGGIILLGLPLSMVLRIAGTRTRSWLIRRWCGGVLAVLGVRLRVTGDLPLAPRGTMVVANHVSWLDVPALGAVQPLRMLAKLEVASWPVIGVLATMSGTVYLDRHRLRSLPATVATLARLLRGGATPLVFPEGTTFCGRSPGRFRPATLQAVVDAAARVRPVGIRYRLADGRPCTVAAYVGDDSLFASLRRVVGTAGLIVELRALPLIDGAGSDRRTLTRHAEASVRTTAPAAGGPVCGP